LSFQLAGTSEKCGGRAEFFNNSTKSIFSILN